MIAEMQYLGIATTWFTPHHGEEGVTARIKERYVGLHGQMRIALVDGVGRVWHYDSDEVRFVFPQLTYPYRRNRSDQLH